MRRALVVAVVLASCSGVSQGELDEVQQRLDETRDDLVAREAADVALLNAEATVAAYSAAHETVDIEALRLVYGESLMFEDPARGLTFRSRRNAFSDLEAGVAAFGIETQQTLSQVVTPERAVVEWEMRGDADGERWSLQGVSILFLSDGLIVRETSYYDLAQAPWG